MKSLSHPDHFALCGAPPLLAQPLAVGQHRFPSAERYAAAMQDIIERQYYTNHGPLAAMLERRLQEWLNVRHAVCVATGDIARVMALEALGLRGMVLVPALCAEAVLGALHWAGLRAVPCDVDASNGMMDAVDAAARLDTGVGAIFAVNAWGGACDLPGLAALAAARGLPLCYDSAGSMGGRAGGRPLGGNGHCEVFDFGSANLINAGEGGCICTDDDALAARLRNIRSSYGAGAPVEVTKTSNGRMSEAQAAMALLALDDLVQNMRHNWEVYESYAGELTGIPGLRLLSPTGVDDSNCQDLVCHIDPDAFGLDVGDVLRVLHAENILAGRPFQLWSPPSLAPRAAALQAGLLQLPLGAAMDASDARAIGLLMQATQRLSRQLRSGG